MTVRTTAEPSALTTRDLLLVTTGRLASTTAFRIVYPLLPFVTTHFAVSDLDAASLIALQTAAAFVSPLGGRLADRYGERRVMIGGLGLFIMGAVLCSVAAAFWIFQLGYILIGLGTAMYLPSGQSYLSARSPYEQRGRILGIFEMSWAVAAIIGVAPLMYLINRVDSLSIAYGVLAVIGIVNALMLLRIPEHRSAQQSAPISTTVLLRQPAIWLILGFAFLTFGGNDLFFVSQGLWLKNGLGADEATIGALFVIIGIAELVGSTSVVAFADRIGKRRSVIYGFIATAASLLLMSVVGTEWWAVSAVFFCFYVLFEYAIVASFPLISEAVPHARATVMALMSVAVGAGRIISSFSSVYLYAVGGISLVNAVAVGVSLLGLFALSRSALTPKR
jgi:predicted MFS family arabinose efflux permease